MTPLKQNLLCILLFFVVVISKAQSIDLEQFRQEQPLKLTGNLSANSVYYNSNQNSARGPFTYFLQGSLNVQWYSFNIPISYSYTNQGENLDDQLPFNFNRLRLLPKYKWISGYIGDVIARTDTYKENIRRRISRTDYGVVLKIGLTIKE